MSRAKHICCIAMLCIAMAFAASCSTLNRIPQAKNQTSIPFDTIFDTITTIDGKLLYFTLENGTMTIYALDLERGTTTKIGTIWKHIISMGDPALVDNRVLMYVFAGNEDGSASNKLYQIDYVNMEVRPLAEDGTCSPFIQLIQTSRGILALKAVADSNRTYFEQIDSDRGEGKRVIEAPEGEVFVTADVSGDMLYVFTFQKKESSGYDYFVRKYALDGFTEQGVIDLKNIGEYASHARIGQMNVMGQYIHMENYSNEAVIVKINGDSVSLVMEERNLIPVRCTVSYDRPPVFFVRGTQECFVFDAETGEMQPVDLGLRDGRAILTMTADDTNLVLQTIEQSESKINQADEIIYLYHYSDVVEAAIK